MHFLLEGLGHLHVRRFLSFCGSKLQVRVFYSWPSHCWLWCKMKSTMLRQVLLLYVNSITVCIFRELMHWLLVSIFSNLLSCLAAIPLMCSHCNTWLNETICYCSSFPHKLKWYINMVFMHLMNDVCAISNKLRVKVAMCSLKWSNEWGLYLLLFLSIVFCNETLSL